MDEKGSSSGVRPTLGQDVVHGIASCLGIDDHGQVVHLGARLQRYTDRYHAAQQGHVVRLTPGGQRTFMRSLAGRIERLSADLAKAQVSGAVLERYKDARPARPGGIPPSLQELSHQLGFLRQIAQDIAEAPPHQTGKKGRPVLDHAVGSFMALFETMTGERARTAAGRAGEADCLTGNAGTALRNIFEAIDPSIDEPTLAGCVNRLTERFHGRRMRECDFDWISAIEDDGTFDVSHVRH